MSSKKNRKVTKRRRTNGSFTRATLTDTVVYAFAASSAVQTTELAPSTGALARLASLGSNFQFYRITSLTAKIFPFSDSTSTTNQFVLTCQPAMSGLSDHTTFANLCEVIPNITISTLTSIPQVLRVSRQHLLGSTPTKWWTCDDAPSKYENVQAHFHICPAGAATSSVMVTFRFNVEFSAPTLASRDLKPRPQLPSCDTRCDAGPRQSSSHFSLSCDCSKCASSRLRKD